MQTNIGVPDLSSLKDQINSIIVFWKANNPAPNWWSNIKGAAIPAINYIVKATDYLIREIEEQALSGPDKKASVLAAMSQIYDAVVPPLLPLWLKPFNGMIKNFVINSLASTAIDFIVAKYNDGSWNATPIPTTDPAPTTTTVLFTDTLPSTIPPIKVDWGLPPEIKCTFVTPEKP